ncbi:MAG TPA: carboxypeptidase regulatory-like domain-containing protein, partial [Gemmatimonadaceae bacterium]
MRRIVGCGFLAVLLLPLTVAAQATGRITGRITTDAGQPVPTAQVVLQSTTLRALADTGGRYVIANVPPGTYTIRATALGHAPQQLEVSVTAGAI